MLEIIDLSQEIFNAMPNAAPRLLLDQMALLIWYQRPFGELLSPC